MGNHYKQRYLPGTHPVRSTVISLGSVAGVVAGLAAVGLMLPAPTAHDLAATALPAPTRTVAPQGAWLGQPRYALPTHLIDVADTRPLRDRLEQALFHWDVHEEVQHHFGHGHEDHGRHARHDDGHHEHGHAGGRHFGGHSSHRGGHDEHGHSGHGRGGHSHGGHGGHSHGGHGGGGHGGHGGHR